MSNVQLLFGGLEMSRLKLRILLICVFGALISAAGIAEADWDPGDPNKMHYPQLPDLSTNGMDVLAGPLSVDPDGTIYYEKFLADDFMCTEDGPITGIHIWCSDRNDVRVMEPSFLSLVIYDNLPADACYPYSRPGQPRWNAYLQPTVERIYQADVYEQFYDPNPDAIVGYDTMVWQYNFVIDPCEAFIQEAGQTYWLGIHHTFDFNMDGVVNLFDLMILKTYWPGSFGWKTSAEQQYEDNAVFTDVSTFLSGPHVVPVGGWRPMHYPIGHPYEGASIDLAFVIDGGEEPQPEIDWGDAPDDWPVGGGYPTLAGNNGANHFIAGPWLGDMTDMPDPEPDGQPDAMAALGDDLDMVYPPPNDDEDGVQIPVLVEGVTDTIAFEVNGGGGVVQIWIDWNQNLSWLDAGEMVYNNPEPDGVNGFTVTPPAGSAGQTFLRARISTGGGLPPDGPASDGEVEDHEVIIEEPPVELDYGDAPDDTSSAVRISATWQVAMRRMPKTTASRHP
jgi:hypothetical protein